MTKNDILLSFRDINAVYNNCMAYDILSKMLDELIEEVYQQGRTDATNEFIDMRLKGDRNGKVARS